MSWCDVLLRADSDINFIFCCSDNFCYGLFTFLLFDILCILEVIRAFKFSIRTSKILMRLNVVLSGRFRAAECSYHTLIFHEKFASVNCKNSLKR